MIKEFFINDLFDEKDVRIPFSDQIKILVAENGYGKTTILNSFYALLSGDISKLRKIQFKKIGVTFNDNTKIEFDKSDFNIDYEYITNHPLFIHFESKVGHDYIFNLIDNCRRYPMQHLEHSRAFREAKIELDIPATILKDFIRDIIHKRSSRKVNERTQEKLDKIRQKFPFKIIHLPTYRRVEEDIRALAGMSAEDNFVNKHGSINFGMSDVKKSIDNITSEILSSSVEWFSRINGEMLSQLVNGFSITPEMKRSVSNPKSVQIVLERIGKHISDEHKDNIIKLISSGEIQNNHEPLVYFVANLLKVYEQQRENDEAIQKFTTVSNRYLADKEISYDESTVTVQIMRKKNKKNVDIESLSSGEKQIISLFALLYLNRDNELAIFFDEPELSLSIEWQKTLLPDIIKSGKCKFLLSTTHSPFIFDNELENNTVALAKYISEK